MPFGVVVVSHGRFAEELVRATATIVGALDGFEAVPIGWDDDVEEGRRRIEAAIRRVDRGSGTLLMTDMFGGTPTNLALSFHDAGRVEIVTGVNLPMLIKLTNLRDDGSLSDTAARIAVEGRQAIHVASELLERRPEAGSAGGGSPER